MTAPARDHPQRWDIFCRLVDNMGDIGVCWRLARTLAVHHGLRVRLWIDEPGAFFRLCPHARRSGETTFHDGVEVRHWREPFPAVEVADVVIEAFACDPPQAYLEAMAARDRPPRWINLEYLSAEDWVSECHLMRSPHPRLGLAKTFFFPGFTTSSGGLLREANLFAERDRFHADADARTAFLARYARTTIPDGALVASLFSYEQPGLAGLLEVWSTGTRDIVVLVPDGRVVRDLARFFGPGLAHPGDHACIGRVHVAVLPFLSQRDYDRLLWSCDLNFVRGEDSFVRAQWASAPFVWHIYRQADDAHVVKLDAFMAHFDRDLDMSVVSAYRAFWRAWNGIGSPARHWPAFLAVLPELARHGREWADRLARQQDLATTLVKFCTGIVK